MDFTKILEDRLESCYAVARLYQEGQDYLLVASEVENACFAYDVNNRFSKSLVWSEVGGTMSIIQVPGSMDFLATQRFYPGFDAKDCRIVHGHFLGDGQWRVEEVMTFPYLHRFDLIPAQSGEILFVGCTIANSKAFVEDWSDDGKIFVGRFDKASRSIAGIRSLPLRLKKNHGYYRPEGGSYSLITGVEGIFRLDFPNHSETGDWILTQLFEEETSDIVQLDLDGDGQLENALIQGFHGDRFRILTEDFTQEIYAYKEPTPFGHAIWAGRLLGQDFLIFGYRDGQKDLLALNVKDGAYREILIEAGVASSNCLAFEKNGKAYLFSANNGSHEVGLYQLS